jgi:hypothetical protein
MKLGLTLREKRGLGMFWEQGAENNIWTQEGGSYESLEEESAEWEAS